MVKRHRSAGMKIELIQHNSAASLCLLPTHPVKHPLPAIPLPPPAFLFPPLPLHSHSRPPRPLKTRQAPCPHLEKACKFQVHTFLLMIYCPAAEFHLPPLPFAEPVASQRAR